MTTATIEQMLSNRPHHLPDIARDPLFQLRARPPEVSCVNPYSPPLPRLPNGPRSACLAENGKGSSPTAAGTASEGNGVDGGTQNENAQRGHGNGDREPTSASDAGEAAEKGNGHQPAATGDDAATLRVIAPSELTLTYLKVLQKSEDYNRRVLIRNELQAVTSIARLWAAFTAAVNAFLGKLEELAKLERERRDGITRDEDNARGALLKFRDQGYRVAKRNEDIRPLCPVLGNGNSVLLEPEIANSLLLEFRWRGGVDLLSSIMVFDDSDRLMVLGSRTEVAKGPHGNVCIKWFGDPNGGRDLGIGGSRDTFHLVLANLPSKARRVVIACFNGTYPGAPLAALSRLWLTLRVPPAGEVLSMKTPSTRELYACGYPAGGPASCLVVASLVRKTHDTWQFACNNEPFMQMTTAVKLASHLSAFVNDRLAGLNAEMQGSFERLVLLCLSTFEDGFRRTLVLTELSEREALRHAMTPSHSFVDSRRATLERRRTRGLLLL